MFRLFVLPALAGSVAILVALALHYMPPPGVPALSVLDAWLAGIAIFALLIVVANHYIAASLAARLERQMAGLASFEADMRRRIARLEAAGGGIASEAGIKSAPAGAALHSLHSVGPDSPRTPQPDDAQDEEEHKVIRFDPGARAARERTPPARLSGSRLAQALEQDAIEAWFQPVITLPGRKTRFFEAIAHLTETADEDGGQSRFIEPGYSRAPEIDRLMLLQALRLLRELDRSGKPSGAIWRLHAPALSDVQAFSAIERILEANASLAGQLVVRIDLRDYGDLDQDQIERLHRLRESGFSLALGNFANTVRGRTALASGLFAVAVMDVSRLLQEPHLPGTGAAGPARRPRENGSAQPSLEIIASGVENESQAMALIDRDVLLAQGDFFSKARPLRRGQAGDTSAAR